MKKWLIEGGTPLRGSVPIAGMKNAALPILFATLVCGAPCTLHNLPDVGDVRNAMQILEAMGARITRLPSDTVTVDPRGIIQGTAPNNLVCRLRGSTYLIGAELARFGCAAVGLTGGCNFGPRPINLHLDGFAALGAAVRNTDGFVTARVEQADGRLTGAKILLDTPSVGATANIMLAATTARGTTVLSGAAREPHIVDLAVFLNACGARIIGAGTSTIRIHGVERTELHGAEYTIVPDMIEAGTYMMAAAITGGDVTLVSVVPRHVEMISDKLRSMGVRVEEGADTVRVVGTGRLRGCTVQAQYYPGFPTDMQPQMVALLSLAEGMGRVTDNVFRQRFRYVEELRRMGAAIDVNEEKSEATVVGVSALRGADVTALDLRAGAALVIAGLAARGTTQIREVGTIERGYVNLLGKLRSLGAHVQETEE